MEFFQLTSVLPPLQNATRQVLATLGRGSLSDGQDNTKWRLEQGGAFRCGVLYHVRVQRLVSESAVQRRGVL